MGNSKIQELLPGALTPIAIAFLDQPPPGVNKWTSGAVPAGCSFWRSAMDGHAFYTEPADHCHCAVGAHTHGLQQPQERAQVLEDTIGFMVGNGYLEMAEVPSIPVLPKAPRYIAYAPADESAFTPDLVLVAAKPYSIMLLYEAAIKAGAGQALTNVLGRPGCAVLPLTANSGATSLSFGCKGNRTFTGLPDEQMYACVPGNQWNAVLEQLESIKGANAAMETYYRQHQAQFPILN